MKIRMIILYFGSFPNYFQFFLDSCRKNKEIEWLIFTDNKMNYDYPNNVKTESFSFDEMKEYIRNKFDFDINIDNVHKLCEYKPAFGYLFEDWLVGYDYWGYCDIDVIYGNILKFLPENLEQYDKIYTLGHFTIMKNDRVRNRLFMKPLKGKLLYQEAFQSNKNYNFDEDYDKPSINSIFREYGYKVLQTDHIADIYTRSSAFRLVKFVDGNKIVETKKNGIFCWDHGDLYRIYKDKNELVKEDFMYIHLQKRKMKIGNITSGLYKIIPNKFENLEVDTITNDNFGKIKKSYLTTQYIRVRYKNLLTKLKEK